MQRERSSGKRKKSKSQQNADSLESCQDTDHDPPPPYVPTNLYSNLPSYAQPTAPPAEETNQSGPLTRSQQVRQQDRELAENNRRISNNPPNYDDMNAAYSIFDRQFGNIFDRGVFLRKAYSIVAGQLTFFVAISTMFVYIPHLRRVFRKVIFDKLFITSSLGFPLILVLLFLMLSHEFRRRLAVLSLLLSTTCLAFLLSYVLTMSDCRQIMSQIFGMNLSIFGVIALSSQLPRFGMRNLKQASLLPIVLSAYNLGMWKAFDSFSITNNWKYWLGSSTLISYVGYNTVSVLNSDTLLLQKNEYPFAANSFLLNLDLFRFVGGLFRSSRRNAYESI